MHNHPDVTATILHMHLRCPHCSNRFHSVHLQGDDGGTITIVPTPAERYMDGKELLKAWLAAHPHARLERRQ